MSILKVVIALEQLYRNTQDCTRTFSTDERQRRLSMLVEWSITLGNHGVAEFQRTLKRHLAGESGNTALSTLQDLYSELGIWGIESLVELCNKA